MKLVVAGLGRTGTQSLVAALQQLGLRTMSQEDFLADLDLLEHLLDVIEAGKPLEAERFAEVDATVGWPMCWAYEQQLELWPSAKCLLNVRDPDAWFDSVEQAWKIMGWIRRLPRVGRKVRTMNRLLEALIGRMEGVEPPARAPWTRGCRAHVAQVEATVPAERLLVWEVGHGWEPLCQLLDVPVPDTPFPRTNTSGSGELRRRVLAFLGRR